ncbi:MAG: hypothetical protein BJ554DRAFT_1437 [Olpidium bornovanus]|uniref:Retrovirus-related Pol polyprotein from transposon TNT 1-94 n=1 Tax=Olpidium bornovanus TaxID=278681 RepID=A0A8H8DHP9_9FUNG|nr:MAG: hypothetical protein BJ554DRAFT_1437 [Olpidium bornovanus]
MVNTRPDLSTAVNFLSRFMANPGDNHWQALKRVPRYLKGMLSLGLQFCKSIPLDKQMLSAFADSDYANDVTDRKSLTGYAFFLLERQLFGSQ